MKRFIALCSMLGSLAYASLAHAEPALSTQQKALLDAAFQMKDDAILDSVVHALTLSDTAIDSKIHAYINDLTNPAPVKPAPVKKEKTKSALTGAVEGGLTLESGNTKSESFYAKTKMKYQLDDRWSNVIKLQGENKKEENIRTKEDYRINNQTRYNFTDRDYGFVELEYVTDRFGGYDRRTSETLGIGHDLWKSDELSVTVSASAGLRQTESTDGVNENSTLGKVGGDFEWTMNDSVSIGNEVDVSLDSENMIIESDAFLKVMMNQSLYVKTGVFVEHNTDAAVGIKKTDTRTTVVLGYDF